MPAGIGSIIGCKHSLMELMMRLARALCTRQIGFFKAFFRPPAVMPTRSTPSPNSTAEIGPLSHTKTMYNKIPVNKSLMFVRRRRAIRLLLLQPAEITLGTNFIKAKKFHAESSAPKPNQKIHAPAG